MLLRSRSTTDHDNIQGWHKRWSQQWRQRGEPSLQGSKPAEKWFQREVFQREGRIVDTTVQVVEEGR